MEIDALGVRERYLPLCEVVPFGLDLRLMFAPIAVYVALVAQCPAALFFLLQSSIGCASAMAVRTLCLGMSAAVLGVETPAAEGSAPPPSSRVPGAASTFTG